MQLLAFLLVTALGIFYLKSHDDYFWVEWRKGRLLVMRGAVPAALLADFRDILLAQPEAQISLRARRASGGPQLLILGKVSEATRQRLFNVFGLYQQRLPRRGDSRKPRNLGQVLGLPWLAFALEHKPGSSAELTEKGSRKNDASPP